MPCLAVCLSSCVSGWGSATARVVCLLDRRLDAMPGASGCARVFGDCDGDGDGESWRCVSASAVVALRAAKRLWRNTKAMRGWGRSFGYAETVSPPSPSQQFISSAALSRLSHTHTCRHAHSKARTQANSTRKYAVNGLMSQSTSQRRRCDGNKKHGAHDCLSHSHSHERNKTLTAAASAAAAAVALACSFRSLLWEGESVHVRMCEWVSVRVQRHDGRSFVWVRDNSELSVKLSARARVPAGLLLVCWVGFVESFCVAFSYTISGFLVRAQWMLNFDVYNVRMRMRMRQAPTPTRHSRTAIASNNKHNNSKNYNNWWAKLSHWVQVLCGLCWLCLPLSVFVTALRCAARESEWNAFLSVLCFVWQNVIVA